MNNEFFFYQEDGQTIGPVSGDELRGRIRDGKLRLFDLILREGDASWRMALEHTEFKADFKDRSRSALRERPWVCLQRKSPDGFDFVTTGPFSQEEVREGLLAGRVSYSDYAWQSGFTEWKRIGLLEEFNPRLRQMQHEPEPPAEEEAAELLKKVIEMKRPRPPVPEPPPPEATSQDLTKGEPPPQIPIPDIPVIPVDEVEEVHEVETSITKVTRKRRKIVPWLDWGIVAILVVVLGAVAAVLSRNIKRTRTFDVPATTVLETVPPPPPNEAVGYEASEEPALVDTEDTDSLPAPEPAPVKPAVKEPPVVEKPERKVSRAPTELYLAVQNRSKSQARVEVRTNGTAEFPVYVQVVGVPGSVSTGPSFYSYLRVKPSGDVRKPLDLSRLKLPQGKLIFRAKTGELSKEARLNLGTGDPQYKKAIGRVRKLHAYAIWRERLQLMRLSTLLVERLNAAVGGQKLSNRGLEALSDVRLSNGHKFALFDDWYELKSVLDDGKKQASPALVSRAKRVRDKMASFSIWK